MTNALTDPAFLVGFECGYGQGLERGRELAEADLAACWAETARKVRALAQRPTYAELQRRRGEAS